MGPACPRADPPPEAGAAYGKAELGANEYVAGEWRSLNGTNLISLAKGEGAESLHHETFHAAMELVLTGKEKAAVLKQYGDEEAAARAYETWNPAEKPDSLFQKIMDFFRRLVEAFFPSAQGVFGKVRSGEVWGREKGGIPPAFGGKRAKTTTAAKGAAVMREGDTWRLQPGEAGKLTAASVQEINALGFNTQPGPVVLTEKNFPHLNDKVGSQIAPEDLPYLQLTVEKPSEILPNLAVNGKGYRTNSILMVRKNGKNFVSIVEITPGENENILWNFWKMDQKNAENYLAKFRQEKTRLLNLEERPTVYSYSSQQIK